MDGNEHTFSGSSAAIKRGLRALDKATQTPYNLLQSIYHDRSVLTRELARTGLNEMQIYGNARTGCWYVPDPRLSVVFKSTDGHYGTWTFSLRRLNLQLLDHLRKLPAAIIVDATKAGQRYPDAIKRTIPIWCLIWTAFLSECALTELQLDSFFLSCITSKERTQILDRAKGHLQKLTQLMDLGFSSGCTLSSQLRNSLPFCKLHCSYWYYDTSGLVCENPELTTDGTNDRSLRILHLISASKETSYPTPMLSDTDAPYYYVQGAADDAESWLPHGLTPAVFTSNPGRFCDAKYMNCSIEEYRETFAANNCLPVSVSRAMIAIGGSQGCTGLQVCITNKVEDIPTSADATCISLLRPNHPDPVGVPHVVSIPIRRNLKYVSNLSRNLAAVATAFKEAIPKGPVTFYSGNDHQVALASFIYCMSAEGFVPQIDTDSNGSLTLIAVTVDSQTSDSSHVVARMDAWEGLLSLCIHGFALQKNLRQEIHLFTSRATRKAEDNTNEVLAEK